MAKEQQISFGTSQSSASMHENYISKESGGAYELGDFDQAFFMYLDGQEHISAQEQRETLNIFPSEPMHVEPSTKFGMSLGASTVKSASKKSIEQPIATSNGKNTSAVHPQNTTKSDKLPVKKEGSRKATTSSSDHEGPKTPDAKTLRRLAQNREAARKSRLRKKAYVQQLESCKMKLNQLEQEIQRARTQGVLLGGGILGEQGLPSSSDGLSSGAAVFDLEYARWLEEHHRLMMELRAAMQERLPENDLHIFVGSSLAHYNTLMNLKSMAIKADVFHIISGMWKTPAERCFLWMGGFCPSEIIKVILSHIDPLTELQLLGISKLQHSAQETEEALSQGLEALYQSLADTIVSNNFIFTSNMANYMGQMAIAMNKLSTLESFVRQADNLRLETLHRLYEILTVRQSAKCLLAISEYFHRLRALSSLWLSRPRHE
ncbi:bZIP transcription factor TGA10 isoform X1 [Dendrobium catenatum]|uniref:Transcription factor HBP-1b(C1) n=1 Tax=Dendrobium catenatum TaxID=906689 RepID=A0A2I0WZB8_9ASPA|nr:bZIP transcription factor TGA10 isoform X1 [Dendrobium catenatum]XP_020700799.1 bZIP transcription factor TGA10 isoform X1 [Dendrobium catenatum]PKU80998.1 Transcription factor HBP-1b(c1) [Dendrobium catenatum]